jgi:N-methylhydantoinase B
MSRATIDPVTLEVVREWLISIVHEMRINLVRTSYSSILYEGEDFSCVLMDALGQIVAMSKGQDHPLHIFPIHWSMRAVLEKFGDDVRPGDVFLHNDPYTGGTHLNDVAMIWPVFVDGTLFVSPVIRAHWADVGGMSAGSLAGNVTEIYQEGIRIPPVRIAEGGKLDQSVLDILFSNMRIADERQGDFRAMVGTCRRAEGRLGEMIGKFGVDTVAACVEQMITAAERRMRARIAALPTGDYVYESYIESSGQTRDPLAVRATVRVQGDRMTIDFDGTAPQVAGPTNVGPAMAATGAFTIVKSLLDPGGDVNQGSLRPIEIRLPAKTIVNASLPAPCGGMVEVKYAVESAVMGALGPLKPDHLTSDNKGGGNHVYISGTDDRSGETFVFYEYPAGGNGAWEGGDGNNAVRTYTESDITCIQPIESIENQYPLRVLRTELRMDSGGEGRWRGGLGIRRDVEVLTTTARLSVLSEKNVIPPYGVRGGGSGAVNRFTVVRDGAEIEPSPIPGKVTAFPLQRGDVVVMRSSGGGGYGDALDRPASLVARDVEDGSVSRTNAEHVWGLAWSAGVVDEKRTARRRTELRSSRVTAAVSPGDVRAGGGPGIEMSAELAGRLAVSEGALVELLNPAGAPLRAWARVVQDLEGDRCRLSPGALALLGRGPGDRVDITVPAAARTAGQEAAC